MKRAAEDETGGHAAGGCAECAGRTSHATVDGGFVDWTRPRFSRTVSSSRNGVLRNDGVLRTLASSGSPSPERRKKKKKDRDDAPARAPRVSKFSSAPPPGYVPAVSSEALPDQHAAVAAAMQKAQALGGGFSSIVAPAANGAADRDHHHPPRRLACVGWSQDPRFPSMACR